MTRDRIRSDLDALRDTLDDDPSLRPLVEVVERTFRRPKKNLDQRESRVIGNTCRLELRRAGISINEEGDISLA